MKLIDPALIPGMIEPGEQKLLFELSKEINLKNCNNVVEFGTFFGRSTACIMNGLLSNNAEIKPNFFAYDIFECKNEGRFSKILNSYVKKHDLKNLLVLKKDRLNFRSIFDFYLNDYLITDILKVFQTELSEAKCHCDEIALMHIDCPKFYEEFYYILNNFFPFLKKGSLVVLQDYFFHWSASLIAAVQLLKEYEILNYKKSTASSLLVEILNEPSNDQILNLNSEIKKNKLEYIIDRAIKDSMKIEMDRKNQFLPRLILAKIQYLWEKEDYYMATNELNKFLTSGSINKHCYNDLIDLMSNGFSIRKLYQLDYSINN